MENSFCNIVDGPIFGIASFQVIPDFLLYAFIPGFFLMFTLLVLYLISNIKKNNTSTSLTSFFIVGLYTQFAYVAVWLLESDVHQKILWGTFLPSETLLSLFLIVFFSKDDSSVSGNWFKKFLYTISAVLIILSPTKLNISGYDYVNCEAILGFLWYVETVFHALCSLYLINKIFTTKNIRNKISMLGSVFIPLSIFISNLSFFVLSNWSNDIFLGFSFIIQVFCVLYLDDSFEQIRKSYINIFIFYIAAMLSFGFGVFSTHGVVGYDLIFSMTLLLMFAITIIFFYYIKKYKKLKAEVQNNTEFENNLLITVEPEMDINSVERPVETPIIHDRLSEIINNMMLSIPGGKYRKLEFVPHSYAQVGHMVAMIGADVRFDDSYSGGKVLVDIGFLLELVRSLSGVGASGIVENKLEIITNTKGITIIISDVQNRQFKDSEEKMARLMSISMMRKENSVELFVPILESESYE